jgi:hypothetical protein
MATSSLYYIDSSSFNTAVSVYTNQELTNKAPDGYYSIGGLYRKQVFGKLEGLLSCTSTPPPPSYYSYIDAPTFVDTEFGGAVTCAYFENPGGEYVRNSFYANTDNLQVGDSVYRDTQLTDKLVPIIIIYFAYTQGSTNKWIRINTSGNIDQIGTC